jgi:hypothetical protein
MERVSGILAGRKGKFALQHSGTMDKGAQTLSVTVVPDSATDDLAGLAGSMAIKIEKPYDSSCKKQSKIALTAVCWSRDGSRFARYRINGVYRSYTRP